MRNRNRSRQPGRGHWPGRATAGALLATVAKVATVAVLAAPARADETASPGQPASASQSARPSQLVSASQPASGTDLASPGQAVAADAAGANPPTGTDEMLRGPHPFLRENELSLHTGYAAGLGDWSSGSKTTLDYGYKLDGSWWLNLELGYQTSACHANDACGGNSAAVLAGLKWKLRTEIPLVPYLKAAAGLLYVFPDSVKSAAGLAVRAGIGAKYFLYDWFGLGAEVLLLAGRAGFRDDSGISKDVQALDVTLGVEVQF